MKLFEFLQEDNGGFSMIRLLSFLSVVCLVIDWMHAVFTTGVWKPDVAVLAYVTSIIGLKVVQKDKEAA